MFDHSHHQTNNEHGYRPKQGPVHHSPISRIPDEVQISHLQVHGTIDIHSLLLNKSWWCLSHFQDHLHYAVISTMYIRHVFDCIIAYLAGLLVVKPPEGFALVRWIGSLGADKREKGKRERRVMRITEWCFNYYHCVAGLKMMHVRITMRHT